MQPLRLALVTPRFWPLAGPSETHLLRLAEQFQAAGHDVTVVTAQWRRKWPEQLSVGPLRVERVRGMPHGGWRTLRYMFALSRWLRDAESRIDIAFVASMKHEAYCALRALRGSRVPVVLQPQGIGPRGDIAWQQTASLGRRIARRCQSAQALVAACDITAQELTAAGCKSENIHAIPHGVPIPSPRGSLSRQAAREAIAAANSDLTLDDQQPLAIAIADFQSGSGLPELVKAWQRVAAEHRKARLWLIGDGPLRDELYRLISDLDLRNHVAIPGVFAETDGLFEAADLFIDPAPANGQTLYLLEAMAAGLPIVASDLPCTRSLVVHGTSGYLAPAGDMRQLAACISHALSNPAEGVALGAAARDFVRERHSLDRSVSAYLDLFKNFACPRIQSEIRNPKSAI